jgi:multidrug resistance protein
MTLRTRQILWLLFASLAIMETGYGIVYPVFAKRLESLGGGVDTLGYIVMAFAAGQFIFAPILGNLADRYGRKPFILLGLSSVAIANVFFLLLDSVPLYITLRFFQGALSAGLLPAAMGVVADLVPEDERGRWGGIVMGGYGAGFILGPAVGGLLYDSFGFQAPFVVSAVAAGVATLLALSFIPETLNKDKVHHSKAKEALSEPFFATLPRPLYLLPTLLLISFLDTFIFAFVEPPLVFYFYNSLNFSTTQFGIIVGAYGLALTLAQTLLGHLSDRFGRSELIALGFALNIPFYVGLVTLTQFWVLLLLALLGGIGVGLSSPASNAYYLDITEERHSSRMMGLKEAAAAAGMIVGPLLVALLSRFVLSKTLFATSAVLTVVGMLLAILVLKKRQKPVVSSQKSE